MTKHVKKLLLHLTESACRCNFNLLQNAHDNDGAVNHGSGACAIVRLRGQTACEASLSLQPRAHEADQCAVRRAAGGIRCTPLPARLDALGAHVAIFQLTIVLAIQL